MPLQKNDQPRKTKTKDRSDVISEKDFRTVIKQRERETEMVPLLLLEELSNPTQTNIPARITSRLPTSVKSYIRSSSIIRENLIKIDVNGPVSPFNSTPVTKPTSK